MEEEFKKLYVKEGLISLIKKSHIPYDKLYLLGKMIQISGGPGERIDWNEKLLYTFEINKLEFLYNQIKGWTK